ncbi:MAG: polysaccharide biosynthesis protein [Ruminococcaceae bacterium]|nr:polysaccharide biosynthesis protein [Oscillospiraceae bacterium]
MEKKKNSLMVQGSILAAAGLLTKIIGFIYRIPMANLLGEQGNGVYSVSFGIYNVALTLSSYSLPLAVSKLVSQRLAKNEEKNSFTLFKRALLFSLIAGLSAFLVLFLGAEWLEALYSRTGLQYPLRVLAPTAFTVALLGVFRGYFQGHSNMVPTALSQIVEQIINAVVSILGTYFFMKAYVSDPNVSAHGAAGATLGTLAGAFGALVMLALLFMTRLKHIKAKMGEGSDFVESPRVSYKDIVLTMFPIILTQSIYQIGFTVDDLIFGNVMSQRGFSDDVVGSLQGVFNTQYTQLINLPIAVATALAASALPSIMSLFTQKKDSEKNAKIHGVIKLTSAVAFPSAVGLTVLARPIITCLFPTLITYRETAINLLVFGSCACIFYSLSTITASVLQGNDRMRIPVKNSFISFALHVIIVFVLLKFTNLSIYALLIGDITFPLVIALLNFMSLKKVGYRQEIKKTFLLPLLISVIMGVCVVVINLVTYKLLESHVISLGISLIVAIMIYGVLTLKFKVFSDEELTDLPFGSKILALSKRITK